VAAGVSRLDRLERPAERSELLAALNCIYALWLRELLRLGRDRGRLIFSVTPPLLMVLFLGAGVSPAVGTLAARQGGMSYAEFVVAGVVVLTVFHKATVSGLSTVRDREFGFLKEVLVAPGPRWATAVGKAIGCATAAVFPAMFLLLVMPLIGIHLSFGAMVSLVPALFITGFALTAMSLVIASRIRSLESFQVIASFLLVPMLFFSSALFPLNDLPAWLAVVARLNPVTYAVDGVRQIFLAGTGVPASAVAYVGLSVGGRPLGPLEDLAIVAAFGILMIVLAARALSLKD
jgi:ABC-2 type transport system permease protein